MEIKSQCRKKETKNSNVKEITTQSKVNLKKETTREEDIRSLNGNRKIYNKDYIFRKETIPKLDSLTSSTLFKARLYVCTLFHIS